MRVFLLEAAPGVDVGVDSDMMMAGRVENARQREGER